MSSHSLDEITNYVRISEKLGSGGQPAPEQFGVLRDAGYDAVINLAMPDSPNALANEQALVAAQGMDYVHIPVVWETPTLQDLERFFTAMDDYQGQRVFVHCAMNMRASVFICLYRVLCLKVPKPHAEAMMRKIWHPNPVWQAFIHEALIQL